MTWDAAKYFSKAKLYWGRATDLEHSSEEFLLSVAYVCEFITRGALVKTSPTLNAANDTESILFASGITPNKPPKTVAISEGLERLKRIVPDLTEDELKIVDVLVTARNDELHGDDSAIAKLAAASVMPRIYSFLVKTIAHAREDLEQLLGKEDAAQALQISAASQKDRSDRVRSLIRISRDRFYALPQERQKELRDTSAPGFHSAVLVSGHHLIAVKCPACSTSGIIAGAPMGRSAALLRNDQIVREIRIVPANFSCKCCNLEIKGLDELLAAGFPHEYRTIDEIDPMEHFGIDPMDHIDVDQVVREYQADMYDGYQDE
jgi:hypothetical protein